MYICPLCQKQTDLLVAGGKDYFILQGQSADFNINYCANCQTAFSLPILTDQELEPYYPKNYEAYVSKKNFLRWLQILKYKTDLKFIKKIIKKNKASIFEIGAGRGEFLAEAKKIGFSVDGIEPGKAGREAAKALFNIDLIFGYANELNFNERYNAIIVRHVFEHLGEPVKVLEKIKTGLADGGILFLKLPRLDSWEAKFFKKYWHGYDLPRHRLHYSAEGITKLLQNFGFSQIKITKEAVPSDIIRSVQYYSANENNLLSKIFKLYLFLPSAVKLVLAQLAAIIFFPFKSGRMIVTAKKTYA
jgi:SAM-dependent methyltransferase